MPLEPGEADRFRQLAAPLVPVERLRKAVGRGRHNGIVVETLAGGDGQCPLLDEAQLCRIHAAHGGESKPRACRIFPLTFVATPTEVRVGLSFACPAVVDGEGPFLEEQRGEIEALFASAVDGTRYLLRVGDSVALAKERSLSWLEAKEVVAALSAAIGGAAAPEDAPDQAPLLRRLCRAGAICALLQVALDERQPFAEGLARAQAGATALVEEALADPPAVDRLSRALFRTLLKSTEPGRGSTLGRLGGVVESLLGGGRVRLRGGGDVAWSEVERVRPGLGPDGERLFARWLTLAMGSLTFFGDAAFGLPMAGGLDLLVLSSAVGVFLARAHAAAAGRAEVSLDDARTALRQIDAGVAHRSAMPSSFGRALEATASLDLLREQLSG